MRIYENVLVVTRNQTTPEGNDMKTMHQLKALAAKRHCTIEDDRWCTKLEAYADEGWSWEDGNLSSFVEYYGSQGDYIPAWRIEAIGDLFERLTDWPPSEVPYIDA